MYTTYKEINFTLNLWYEKHKNNKNNFMYLFIYFISQNIYNNFERYLFQSRRNILIYKEC